MKVSKKKVAAGLAAGAITLTGAGVAYAYWTTSGTGSGSAATGDATAVTVTQVGSVSSLVPGGDPQDVDFKISNPASTAQYVTSVHVSVAGTDSNGDPTTWSAQADTNKPACTAADFDVVQPNAIGQDLASGDTTFHPSGATIALKDLATNQDNCKNLSSVPLYFAAS